MNSLLSYYHSVKIETPIKLAVMQPQFLPWRGLFELIEASDQFVFYDDVQFPQSGGRTARGYFARVQVKSCHESTWLTVPIRKPVGKCLIKDVIIAKGPWREKHLKTIQHCYSKAPYYTQVYEDLVKPVYSNTTEHLSLFCIDASMHILQFIGINKPVTVSSETRIAQDLHASERLLALCKHFNASTYITAQGARSYLDHELFESSNIDVCYMDYALTSYPQLYGKFTPYVSIIDLLFNVGPNEARSYLAPRVVPWRLWIECHPNKPA